MIILTIFKLVDLFVKRRNSRVKNSLLSVKLVNQALMFVTLVKQLTIFQLNFDYFQKSQSFIKG